MSTEIKANVLSEYSIMTYKVSEGISIRILILNVDVNAPDTSKKEYLRIQPYNVGQVFNRVWAHQYNPNPGESSQIGDFSTSLLKKVGVYYQYYISETNSWLTCGTAFSNISNLGYNRAFEPIILAFKTLDDKYFTTFYGNNTSVLNQLIANIEPTVTDAAGVVIYPGARPTTDTIGNLPILSVSITPGVDAYEKTTYYTNEAIYTYNWVTKIIGGSKLWDPNDPNDGGGNSTGGGGGGDGDIGGTPHETGTLPTITALDSGLMTLYNPTVSELQSLGRFLWSDAFSLDTFKKLFNDPFDTLLGLSIVPVKPNVSGTHNIIFGNLDSGISSSIIGNQFVEVDCGSFTLNEVWKGSLDYSPYTEVSIYLPFIGVRQLNCNDVMGSVLHLYYRFDVLTGSVIAEITVNHSEQGNKSNGFSYNADMGSVYTFEGQCSVNVPLSSQDFTNTIRAAIGAVGMVAGATASIVTGNPALGVASLAVGSANAVTQSMTPTVERSGHLSSSASMLASLEPCLFVTRPHQCKPQRYYALRGVPSQVYVSKLSSCTGFFQISDVQNIRASGASDVELQELKQILTQGVFVDSWS